MDVVIRSVNQRFLDEVAFPFLRKGMTDRQAALVSLLDAVDDGPTRVPAEALLEGGDPERFGDVVYRLLFSEWWRGPGGWEVTEDAAAYAGGLEETVNAALMLTDPGYPYWDAPRAQAARDRVLSPPFPDRGLAAFLGGVWSPVPDFDPGEALATRGVRAFRPREGFALADWSYRPPHVVSQWSGELPRALRDLMQRECARLRPVEVPEAAEVIDFWLGRAAAPPPLTVSFTGLGPGAFMWVRTVAQLSAQLRRAASREQALTVIITGSPSRSL